MCPGLSHLLPQLGDHECLYGISSVSNMFTEARDSCEQGWGRGGGKLQTKPENRQRESPGRVYIKLPSKMVTLKS